MVAKSFFVISLLTSSMGVLAQDLSAADVPSACTAACKPITDLTASCKNGNTPPMPGMSLNKPRYVLSNAAQSNSLSGKNPSVGSKKARYVMSSDAQGNALSGKNPSLGSNKARYVATNNVGENSLSGKNFKLGARYVQTNDLSENDFSGKNVKLSSRQATASSSSNCVCRDARFDFAQVAEQCSACLSQNGAPTDQLSQLESLCSATQPTQPETPELKARQVKGGAAQTGGVIPMAASAVPQITRLSVNTTDFPATRTEARFEISLSTMVMYVTGAQAANAAPTGSGATGQNGAKATKNAAADSRIAGWESLLSIPVAVIGVVAIIL